MTFADLTRVLPRRDLTAAPVLRDMLGIAILLIVIALIEPLFGAGSYATLEFHPFWVVVLIAALQQGLAGGVVAVVMATLLLDMPDRLVGEDATVYLARSAVLPLRWLIVALLVGLIRQAQLREVAGLKAESARLARANEVLAQEVERMDAMVVTLERQAVAREVVGEGRAAQRVSPLPSERAASAKAPTAPAPGRTSTDPLSALSQASAHDLPAAFAAARAALFDAPAVLVIEDADGAPLILGDIAHLPDGPEDAAFELLDAMPDSDRVEIEEHDTYGWIAAAARWPAGPDDLQLVVVAFADDARAADALRGDVARLADAAQVSVSRLAQGLSAAPDAK